MKNRQIKSIVSLMLLIAGINLVAQAFNDTYTVRTNQPYGSGSLGEALEAVREPGNMYSRIEFNVTMEDGGNIIELYPENEPFLLAPNSSVERLGYSAENTPNFVIDFRNQATGENMVIGTCFPEFGGEYNREGSLFEVETGNNRILMKNLEIGCVHSATLSSALKITTQSIANTGVILEGAVFKAINLSAGTFFDFENVHQIISPVWFDRPTVDDFIFNGTINANQLRASVVNL